jgi:hypothetical protein
MRAFGIVEIQVSPDCNPRLLNIAIGVQIDLFIFDGSPQPFHENVISPGSFAIHADSNFFASFSTWMKAMDVNWLP